MELRFSSADLWWIILVLFVSTKYFRFALISISGPSPGISLVVLWMLWRLSVSLGGPEGEIWGFGNNFIFLTFQATVILKILICNMIILSNWKKKNNNLLTCYACPFSSECFQPVSSFWLVVLRYYSYTVHYLSFLQVFALVSVSLSLSVRKWHLCCNNYVSTKDFTNSLVTFASTLP